MTVRYELLKMTCEELRKENSELKKRSIRIINENK